MALQQQIEQQSPAIFLARWLLISLLLLFAPIDSIPLTDYSIPKRNDSLLLAGIGIADCTGPAGGVNFMGYAMPRQITQGVHTRLRSRAYIFIDRWTDKRVIFCSADLPMISQNVKRRVIQRLQELYADLYTERNVLLTGTHTHAGPGGYHEYLLYSVTSLGYVEETARAMVDGIVQSIRNAHRSIGEVRLSLAVGQLWDANINRSPTSYLANPASERALYATEGDTDKNMTVLRISSATNSPANASDNSLLRGMIAWFAVHCTSMNNTNRLISGDNKGYASYLMEKEINYPAEAEYRPFSSPQWAERVANGSLFVAAFAQSNEGDVSPNTNGSFCLDSGQPCDPLHSTCPDYKGRPRAELCHARGPGWSHGDTESTRLIGMRQYLKARQLLRQDEPQQQPMSSGEVDYAHAWVDMSRTIVRLSNGSAVRTCPPARGYSFAAGTTDGPGAFDFRQGELTENPLWNFVRRFIKQPTAQQVQCQWPKPILLDTGEIQFPYPWEPSVVDFQLFRLGDFVIIGVPSEMTTMAGRRLREAVRKVFVSGGLPNVHVVISGLSNSYSAYVTTFEEYQQQRYEAASTIYGPYTLDAYIQEFTRLARKMVPVPPQTPQLPPVSHDPQVPPEDFTRKGLLTFLTPVVGDAVPPGERFGKVVPGKDIASGVVKPGETVSATFYAGHPRIVPPQSPGRYFNYSFMQVERLNVDRMRTEVEPKLRAIISERYPFAKTVSVFPSNTSDHSFMVQLCCGDYEKLSFQQQPPSEVEVDKSSLCTAQQFTFDAIDVAAWEVVRDDDDWDTRFHWWKPLSPLSAISYARLEWTVSQRPDQDVFIARKWSSGEEPVDLLESKIASQPAFHRLVYRGFYKEFTGSVRQFTGYSRPFIVSTDPSNFIGQSAPLANENNLVAAVYSFEL